MTASRLYRLNHSVVPGNRLGILAGIAAISLTIGLGKPAQAQQSNSCNCYRDYYPIQPGSSDFLFNPGLDYRFLTPESEDNSTGGQSQVVPRSPSSSQSQPVRTPLYFRPAPTSGNVFDPRLDYRFLTPVPEPESRSSSPSTPSSPPSAPSGDFSQPVRQPLQVNPEPTGVFDPSLNPQYLQVEPEPASTASDLPQLGDRSSAVLELQNQLTAAGYFTPATGIFSEQTQQSLRQFQQAAGLEVTGVADAPTLAALRNEGYLAQFPAEALLELGDREDAVRQLQRQLADLGYFFGSVNGVFDSDTQQAILAYQQASGLNPTGIYDSATADALSAE